MNRKYTIYILVVILVLLASVVGFLFGNNYGKEKILGELEPVIQEYEKQLEIAKIKYDESLLRLEDLSNEVVSLKREVVETEKNLSKVKVKYEKQIKDLSTYTVSELEQFFLDRYGSVQNTAR